MGVFHFSFSKPSMRAADEKVLSGLIGIILGGSLVLLSSILAKKLQKRTADLPFTFNHHIRDGFCGAIGGSPLIYLRSVSEETGCHIFGKAEFMNPGGSVKDRAAKYILQEALDSKSLQPGGTVVEGTVGSTGIALALQARAKNCYCSIFMPNDTAMEKSDLLIQLGCTVKRVPPVSIVNPEHYVNSARKLGTQNDKNFFFSDQFENLANFKAHYTETGPEIWSQAQESNLKINAIVMGAGTGGTISGVTRFLKEKDTSIRSFLVDPVGSGLFNKVNNGVMYATEEAEGKRKRHQIDNIIEGVGLNRLTKNFEMGLNEIEKAYRCTDQEAVLMSRYLIKREGLFLGGSSALNVVGAVKVANDLPPGSVIVTMLCDGGHRYMSNFYSDEFLATRNIPPSADFPNQPTLKDVLGS